MKTLFRVSTIVALAAMFVWTGVALSEEAIPEAGSFEYLQAMETGALPSQIAGVISEAGPEAESAEAGLKVEPALETGKLPAEGFVCESPECVSLELGWLRYRAGIDTP